MHSRRRKGMYSVMLSSWGVLLLAGASLACHKQSPPANTPASDPRAAAIVTFNAYFEGTREQFLATLDGTPQELQVAGICFDYERGSLDFREAFIRTYGASAWGGHGPVRTIRQEKEAMLLRLAADTFKISGHTAAFQSVGFTPQYPMLLIENGGVWKIRAATVRLDAPTQEVWKKAAALMTKYRRAIGKPGIAPGDIREELLRAVKGESDDSQRPHKFNIDEIQ